MSRKDWTNEKVFQRLLNNKTEKSYWKNIQELRSRATEDIYKQAYILAKSDTEKHQKIGIDILAQLGYSPRLRQQETIDLYFELLNSIKSLEVLFSLLFGISHNNDNLNDSQVSQLVRFKNHKDKNIRYSLTHALNGINNGKSIQALIELTEDKYAPIRNWATFGLGTLCYDTNEQIIEALQKRTKDKHQETKLEALVGLAERNVTSIKGEIIKELKGGEFGTLLFEAITLLNDKDFIPYLEHNLKSAEKENDINERWLNDLKGCLNSLRS
ncbi:hypothetical protein [Aureibacter tunicatorum]|uniref:HEAT repeat domain-containing protein n=1 Tax=Aureibacter tunicatorum TaxID=866807 RepID=A0AAE4BS50_9BACT|nr:hypothetical protein [Aureibacter tunicatorum]MDR6238510.1 hypothetical protein [Aureibacter tunicatorum]BDD05557.1 hypothetical protein AUTU_30400 [Aureibacter tunicatorum]